MFQKIETDCSNRSFWNYLHQIIQQEFAHQKVNSLLIPL
ncbi:hypothetical protein Bsph_0710 [Lysinibacillus sphaericus C3-41]|uniref:Uncharacterized protein n=1 Tax=Lysinibacillus sphaericus (strain C3-41) TaxID=444177 RepID=B1HY69_LYSSC|nr:hypothetical protein Bsph_0710 [Lysinibacillus sphaericus C3-41]